MTGAPLDLYPSMGLAEAARTASQFYDEALKGSGLKITQFSILAALYYAPDVPLSKLARRLVIDRTTLTRNLRLLVRDGLVVLNENPGDKRERRVALTDRGDELLVRFLPDWRRAQTAVIQGMGRDQWDVLRLTLRKAVAVATQAKD